MSEIPDLRPLLWIASSKRDLLKMPDDVIDDFGRWLLLVQKGKDPKNSKPLSGFGGAQILELWRDHSDGTFRTVYTVKFAGIVVVLHAFQKKSKKGIKTDKQDIELIHSRLKLAEILYEEWKEKGGSDDQRKKI